MDREEKRLKFIGAGTLLDGDIVATVAHKMVAYQCEHCNQIDEFDSSLIHFSKT